MDENKSNAATKAKNKYNAKAYDRIHISVKKGNKEIIETAAQEAGMSFNGYVLGAVNQQLVSAGHPSIMDIRDGD